MGQLLSRRTGGFFHGASLPALLLYIPLFFSVHALCSRVGASGKAWEGSSTMGNGIVGVENVGGDLDKARERAWGHSRHATHIRSQHGMPFHIVGYVSQGEE